MNWLVNIFTSVIDWINGGIGFYAISLLLFTLLIRLVVFPLDVKSRKGMRKMSKIQPKINELQKKYANDQAKLQRKQQELMKAEHYNPLSGCLPMLLQYPILILMFYAMRSVANREMARQVLQAIGGNENPVYGFETFLWVKNIWSADSMFASVAPAANGLSQIDGATWLKAFTELVQDPGKYGITLEDCRVILQTLVNASPSYVNGIGTVTEEMWNNLSAYAPEVLAAVNGVLDNPETLPAFGSLTQDQLALIQNALTGIGYTLQKDMGASEMIDLFRRFIEADMNAIGGVWEVQNCLCSCSGISSNITSSAVYTLYAATPFCVNNAAVLTQVPIFGTFYKNPNGLMILAVLSLVSQIFMTKVNPATPQEQEAAMQKNDPKQQQGAGMTKVMKYFFPAFSFYCCVSSYAAFALYWVFSNIVMITLTFVINKYLDKKEAEDESKSANKTVTGEGKIR